MTTVQRALAIDAGRWYMRFQDGKFYFEDGDRVKAIEGLRQIVASPHESLDPCTLQDTASLLEKHSKALKAEC